MANADKTNANIFGYEVADPQAYGVVEFDRDGKAVSLEEKPRQPTSTSTYAVPGLCFYPDDVCERATALKPSLRGSWRPQTSIAPTWTREICACKSWEGELLGLTRAPAGDISRSQRTTRLVAVAGSIDGID